MGYSEIEAQMFDDLQVHFILEFHKLHLNFYMAHYLGSNILAAAFQGWCFL